MAIGTHLTKKEVNGFSPRPAAASKANSVAAHQRARSPTTVIPTTTRLFAEDEIHHIEPEYDAKTVSSFAKYKTQHAESIESPKKFWGDKARTLLHWDKPFDVHSVMQGNLQDGE